MAGDRIIGTVRSELATTFARASETRRPGNGGARAVCATPVPRSEPLPPVPILDELITHVG